MDRSYQHLLHAFREFLKNNIVLGPKDQDDWR